MILQKVAQDYTDEAEDETGKGCILNIQGGRFLFKMNRRNQFQLALRKDLLRNLVEHCGQYTLRSTTSPRIMSFCISNYIIGGSTSHLKTSDIDRRETSIKALEEKEHVMLHHNFYQKRTM